MSVIFNSLPIFGTGPMRSRAAPGGQQIRLISDAGGSDSGYQSLGPLALGVTVTGRIIEPGDQTLEEMLAAIDAQARDPAITADLQTDDSGMFPGVSLVKFTRTGPIDRGRVRSVGFEALFVRLPN